MSINYCVGSISAKRRYFREQKPRAVCADNEDILGFFRLAGKLYCLPGKLPFADMKAQSYIAYQRALFTPSHRALNKSEIEHILKEVNLKLPLKRKIKSLSRLQFRHLVLACKWQPDTDTVYVNFDGLAFSRSVKREMRRLLKKLGEKFEVFVAVSDSRFIPNNARVVDFSGERTMLVTRPKKQKSVAVSKRVLTRYLMNKPYFTETLNRSAKPVLIES